MVVKRRSPNYPGINLQEATEVIGTLYQGGAQGHGVGRGQFTPQDAATAWGYGSTSGPVKIRLAAFRQYGLVEGKKGDNPKLSRRALTLILRDQGAREHREALREAALDPAIFTELHQAMPGAANDALRQFLIVERNFTNEGATRLIEVYNASMVYAGLDEHNDERDNMAAQEDADLGEPEEEAMVAQRQEVANVSPASITIPIPLPDNRTAIVILPREMRDNDWTLLDRILSAYKPQQPEREHAE